MNCERLEGSSRGDDGDDDEDINNNNTRNDDANVSHDIETDKPHRNTIRNNNSNRRPIQPIPSYAIPLTRRNVTRIPVATPIRWDQQDPPKAAPEQPILLPKISTFGCVMGSLIVTLLAWLFAAVVTTTYAFVVWNSILYFFGEGKFYDWAQENNTIIEIEYLINE